MMRKNRRRNGKKRKSGRFEDESSRSAGEIKNSKAGAVKLGAFYAAGPALAMNAEQKQRAADGQNRGVGSEYEDGRINSKNKVEPVLPVQVQKETDRTVAFANHGSVRLRGRTDADFSHSYETVDVTTSAATGCRGCPDSNCIRARGTLINRYRVTTRVTLPSAASFSDLSECQRQRVHSAINNILAPHEQNHVRAFNTYQGTTRQRFDLTLCRNEFNGAISSLAESAENSRRSAAQAVSDALDPFYFDVDIDCEDAEEGAGGSDTGDNNENEKKEAKKSNDNDE